MQSSYTLLLCLTFVQPYYTDHLRKWNAMISQAGNLDDMKEGAENSGAFAGLGKSGLPSYRCSFSFLNRSQMAHFYTKLILIHPLQQCLWINYVIPNQWFSYTGHLVLLSYNALQRFLSDFSNCFRMFCNVLVPNKWLCKQTYEKENNGMNASFLRSI